MPARKGKSKKDQGSPFKGVAQQRYVPNQRSKQNARWARHR